MITTIVKLETSSVLSVDNKLLYSCNEINLSCRVDVVTDDFTVFILGFFESWKSGKSLVLIYIGGDLEEILAVLADRLELPVSCKVVENNRYGRTSTCEEWAADTMPAIYRNLYSRNTIKGISLMNKNPTFVTDDTSILTIIPIQPKLSLKIQE
jgi:hypothetical protein